MAIRTAFYVLAVLLFVSCSDTDDGGDANTEVQIRLANTSTVAFEDATFNGENFGNLAPNEKSEYRLFKGAYHYGQVSITIDGEAYGWIPIDYVGETPLAEGKYTFEYSFDVQNKILSDKLIKD